MLAALLATYAKSHSPQRKPGIANRLWAYQLQEQALNDWDKANEKKPAAPTDAKPAVAGPQRKVVPPRRKSSVKSDTEAPIQLDFPLLLSPIREQPTLQDLIQDLAPLPRLPAAQFSPRVYHRVATVYSIAAAREKRQSRRRRAAAFLLLAA